MSFILDALRKSDLNRRTQRGPDLSAVSGPHIPSRLKGRRQRQWRIIAMLALLIALAILLWVRPELVARVLPREAPPPRPDLQTLIIPALPGEPAAVARMSVEEPILSEPEADPPIPEPELITVIEVPEPILSSEPIAASMAPAPVPSPTVDSAQVAEVGDEGSPPDYLLFWELPLEIRQNLPPLSLSLHVFTSEPARRFVLINGQRKSEGAALDRGVTLVEIRPEGAILEFRNHRFLLSR